MQICLSFYEIKNKQPTWFSNKIERSYWEQWYINLNVAHSKPHSSKSHHTKLHVDPGGMYMFVLNILQVSDVSVCMMKFIPNAFIIDLLQKVLLRRGMYAELPWRHHSVKSCSRSSNLSMKRRITFPLYLILRVLLFHVKLQFQGYAPPTSNKNKIK